MIIKDKQGRLLGDFELFERDGLWGILVDRIERVPFCHKTRFGAIDELMFFRRDNLEKPPHRKYLDNNHTSEQIDIIEFELMKYELEES